jgi:drug/metabolite transporter (DMT)-like permease
MTNESLLIGAAVFMVAFGVFVTVLERIRHPPATPAMTFTGLAGVYLGPFATVEHIRWLYVPCLILLLGVAAIQLPAFRRSGREDDNRGTGGAA